MGKYIFLTGLYLPKPGATGMCVHQLAKEAAKRGHDVTTICYEDGDETSEFDDVKVIKIPIPGFLRENRVNSAFVNRVNQIRSILSKLIHIREYPLRSLSVVKCYCNELEKLIVEGETTIVASVNPLEAVIAADRIKHRYGDKVKTVYYCADTLSNEKGDSGILPAEYRTKCGLRWEKKLFSSFDLIMIMECHKEHYYGDYFSAFKSKMKIVNFPLLSRVNATRSNTEGEKVKFVYAGSLYKQLRNPQYLCDVLVILSQEIDMGCVFLGGGDCSPIINSANSNSNGAIRYIGMQPHSVAMQLIYDADILLSIGNAESPMAPSKIYEYMSTGKPIIHTYTYDRDPCIEPLKKYGNAMLLKDGDSDGIEKIRAFVSNRKQLKFEDVKKNFESSTPGYSVDLIESI